MKHAKLGTAFLALSTVALAQSNQSGKFTLALAEHSGALIWEADGFKVVEASAKPNGREIGFRGRDDSGRMTFLGFLFLVPESAPLTSAKCRDQALSQEKKDSPGSKILETSEIARPGGLPVSLATYTSQSRDGTTNYHVRGFVATQDICGDLEFYSDHRIVAGNPDLARIFSSYQLQPDHRPDFEDIFRYAQVLFEEKAYAAAAPVFEKALALLPDDHAPFTSALLARRVATDQAGMSYGIAGNLARSSALFQAAIAKDPDYPIYYYNLACADAEEKNLKDARIHLQQAFARRSNVNAGETMPDPAADDSFTPYKGDKEFWTFVEHLKDSK
jgi:tetratricopeptide (TPR) repeat protein